MGHKNQAKIIQPTKRRDIRNYQESTKKKKLRNYTLIPVTGPVQLPRSPFGPNIECLESVSSFG